MILEHALITVRPGTQQEFEDAMRVARHVISAAPGFVSYSMRHGVESPNSYLLLVGWETVEDHTVGFHGSPAFAEWRSHIGPFFDGESVVDHYEVIDGLT